MPRLTLVACFTAVASLAAVASTAGCSDYAQVTTRFAPDFAPGRHTVSVLGIFKDGQMSSEAWESIGARLSAPFGGTCETGYGQLVTSNPGLSSAVDDYVRANGPGDEMLEQLAPAATGDLVVVFTFAGHVSTKPGNPTDTSSMSTTPPGGSMGAGGGKYRGMRPGGATGRGIARPTAIAALQISASFYSVSQKKAVGLVAMDYDGASLDEAFEKMAAKVSASLPGSTCGGWNWKAPVDEGRLRGLIEH